MASKEFASARPPLQAKYVPEDWWDPRRPDCLFRSVYRVGDDSVEGHLLSQALTREQRTVRECDLVERLIKPRSGAMILDCPCGIGRHCVELASRGYRTIGVDLDAGALAQAQSRAYERGCRRITLHQADMRSIPLPDQSVAAVINMFFSFGFFLDESSNMSVLREFARVLKQGGTVLLHTDVNPTRVLQGVHGDRTTRTLPNGHSLLVHERYHADIRRLVGTWSIKHDSKTIHEASYSVRIYSDDELRELFGQAGLKTFYRFNIGPSGLCRDPLAEEVVYIAMA